MKYRISEAAHADLVGIREYSTINWGPRQAKNYVRGLLAQVKRAAKHPQIGRPVDHVVVGVRMVSYQSHTIYYRVSDNGIEILRVLHGRMNPPLHL